LRWRTFSTAKKRDLKTCKVPVWLTVLTKTGTQTVNIDDFVDDLGLFSSTFRQQGTWEKKNVGKGQRAKKRDRNRSRS
jgi:uncharacterized GH25 family protein